LKEALGLGYKNHWVRKIFMMMSEEAEQLDFRAVILVKQETLALVGMATTPEGARVARFDPRSDPSVSVGPLEDTPKAAHAFRRSLQTSRDNVWTIIYDGPPLIG
jgi:hypothetical protein